MTNFEAFTSDWPNRFYLPRQNAQQHAVREQSLLSALRVTTDSLMKQKKYNVGFKSFMTPYIWYPIKFIVFKNLI